MYLSPNHISPNMWDNTNPNFCCIFFLVESPSLTSSPQCVLACLCLIEWAWGFGLFWSCMCVCVCVCPGTALGLYYGCGLAGIRSLLICKHTPPPSRSSEGRCPHIRKRSDLIASPRATWERMESERDGQERTENNTQPRRDASDELRSAACLVSQGEGERSDWRVLQQIKNPQEAKLWIWN